MSAFPHEQETAALDQAAGRAVDLIYEFAERDPNDASESNPWKDPKCMYEQLDSARVQVMEAAQALKQAVANNCTAMSTSSTAKYDEEYLRAQFMDMITDAFADVLNNMKENQEVDVDILADCLQSGMELLSQEDREFFLLQEDDSTPSTIDEELDPGSGGDDTTKTVIMTPHEQRRQDLGFVQTTAA
ncbi:hypothetical protein ACA910_017196 [Epithemia clementina (nom. ined.)]